MTIGICSNLSLGHFLNYLDGVSAAQVDSLHCGNAPAVDSLVFGLLNNGHDVVVFTLSKYTDKTILLPGKHLKIYVCPQRKRARTLALTFFHKEIVHLRHAIAQEKLDIINAQWTYEYALATVTASCPKVVTVRDIAERIFLRSHDLYRLFRYFLNLRVFSYASKLNFIANSPYTAREVHRFHRSVRCEIIPNSVRPEFICDEICDSRKPIIISVANSPDRWKNIPPLIKAFQLVRSRLHDAELWLVGGGFSDDAPFAQELRETHPDWTKNIRFCGAVSHDQLVTYYKNAMVLMHPSLEETLGNVLLEAMGCGTVAMGGAHSGAVPWVLDEGRAGILCNVQSPEDIADKLLQILTNQDLWEKFSSAGNLRVKTHFTENRILNEVQTYYRKVIAG